MRTSFIFITLLSAFVCLIILTKCAQVRPVTGGPKDTIPPNLVNTNPKSETINFDGKKIILEFDEIVKVDALAKNLIVTPAVEQEDYKMKTVNNVITLDFKEGFEENTTYTFNFGEAIKDVTESNLAENVYLAFSTGDFIDSLSISGNINNLMTQQPGEGYIVSLYRAFDTVDIFQGKPRYLTKTREDGTFRINNIADGAYRLYALKEENGNFNYDNEEESYAFLPDTITISENRDGFQLYSQKVNALPLRVQSSRTSGVYYELALNKPIDRYELKTADPDLEGVPISSLNDERKLIRIYNTFGLSDSLEAQVVITDSIGQRIEKEFYIKFAETRRKQEEFKQTVLPDKSFKVDRNLPVELKFNKPIAGVTLDSIIFMYDSANIISLTNQEDITWNADRTRANFNFEVSSQKATALLEEKVLYREQQKIIQDSLAQIPQDTTVVQAPDSDDQDAKPAAKKPRPAPLPKEPEVRLYLGKAAFVSIENDSSKRVDATYKFIKDEDFATLKGVVFNNDQSFFLQLVDTKFNVISELYNVEEFTFDNIKPGEYFLRILIDANDDGVWDKGSLRQLRLPEPVIMYEEEIILRANWEKQDVEIYL